MSTVGFSSKIVKGFSAFRVVKRDSWVSREPVGQSTASLVKTSQVVNLGNKTAAFVLEVHHEETVDPVPKLGHCIETMTVFLDLSGGALVARKLSDGHYIGGGPVWTCKETLVVPLARLDNRVAPPAEFKINNQPLSYNGFLDEVVRHVLGEEATAQNFSADPELSIDPEKTDPNLVFETLMAFRAALRNKSKT